MRILIVRACAIGDFVLNLPALRALAKLYPDARFTLVGYPATLELARLFLPVDAVHSLETQPWSGLFIAPQRELRFDAAYVWMRNVVVAENLQKSGIPLVLHAAPFPETGHAADYLLKSIGCIAPDLPDLWTPGSDRLLLHPGSGGASKVWPYFDQLIALEPQATIILGPCETGFNTVNRRLEGLSLPKLAEELRVCRLFVGNDSGITHIAAYLGTPTVALFGPTDPAVWGPIGRRVRVLKRPLLSQISVQDVRKLL